MGFKVNMPGFVTMMVAVAILLGALPAAAGDAAAQARFEASKKQLEEAITSARAAGNSAEIISALEKLFQLTAKILGASHPETVTALGNLVESYYALAQHDQTKPLMQHVLAILEKVLGPEHPDLAIALLNAAERYSELGQHFRALPLLQRALAIREKVMGPKHPQTATALNNLGYVYLTLEYYDQALPLLKHALEISEKAQGPEHPDTAIVIGNLALTYSALAQYDRALPLLQRALVVQEKVRGSEHPDTATALGNLALTYSALGQHNRALSLRLRVLAIREKVQGPEHRETAKALNNLAVTYSALGQHDQALRLQQRALAILEKVLGPEHLDTAAALGNLAQMYDELAQHDQATALKLRVLAILEKVLGPEHPHIALALHNLAFNYNEVERHDLALPLQLRALEIHEKVLAPEHPSRPMILLGLSRTYQALGSSDLAIFIQKQGVNILQNIRRTVSRIDAEALNSYTNSVEYHYQGLASMLTNAGRLAEAQYVIDMLKEYEQFEFIRRSSNADPRQRRIGLTPDEQLWMGRYRQIADRLFQLGQEEQALQKQAQSGLTPEQNKRLQQIADDLKVAQAAFESFLKDLRKNFADSRSNRSAEYAETSVAALRELQGLLKGLGQDTALVQYFITENQLGMLITTGAVQRAHMGNMDAKDLNRKIAEFRRQLNDPKSNPQPLAQELFQLLFAPIANDLEQAGIRNVMLSPDGVLRYVPFAALHDGQGFLIQRFNLPVYTSVARERLRAAVSPNWRAAGLGVTRRHGEFSPLPAVKAEMESIIKTGARGVLPGEVHLDEAFTANKLQDVAQRRFPVMHIASHFRFSPGTEINSFLLLGDGQRLTLGDLRTQNYRFDGVDLLTLSACETGLGGGRDARGREIEGFGVIAQQQGANAVLATLWPVADQSTALLMAEMYRLRQDKQLSKAEALRQAQLSLQKQARYAHPYYWAPFILMGNWK